MIMMASAVPGPVNGLENRYARKGIEGSNPSLSARLRGRAAETAGNGPGPRIGADSVLARNGQLGTREDSEGVPWGYPAGLTHGPLRVCR